VRQRKEICRTRSQLLDRQEEHVGNGLKTQVRRVMLQQVAPEYHRASWSQKQQIPIRTFAQWDEAKPGFLEVDLVAHCGGRLPLHHHAD